MTRDELLALRVRCPVCAGVLCVEGFLCRTCIGTGYVLPATAEVLALAGDDEETNTADFWREVALKAAAAMDYDYPMDWDAEQVVAAIVEEVRTARRKAEEAGETLPPDPLPSDPVAAVCAITSHDGAVAIPQALMLLSKEYGLTAEQATELLIRASRLRPECVYLERTSAFVVGYDSDERGKTITVDGYLRSHARIMPSRLAMAKEAGDAD